MEHIQGTINQKAVNLRLIQVGNKKSTIFRVIVGNQEILTFYIQRRQTRWYDDNGLAHYSTNRGAARVEQNSRLMSFVTERYKYYHTVTASDLLIWLMGLGFNTERVEAILGMMGWEDHMG